MDDINYLTLVTNWQTNRCVKSRNQIVMNVLKLIQSVVKQFKSRESREDLFNEGVIGVIEACDTYEHSKGSFLTYAKTCAKFKMMEFIRHDSVIPSGSPSMHSSNLSFHAKPRSHSEIVSLAQKRGLPYSTVARYAMNGQVELNTDIDAVGNDVTLQEVENIEQMELLAEKFRDLKPRHQQIISEYFIEEKTYETISQEFGVSNQRIGQIIKTVVEKLRV